MHIVQNFILNTFWNIMLLKIFVVFEISDVNDLRILSLKSLITYMFAWGLSSHSRIVHSYGDVTINTITGEDLQI